MHFLAPFPIIFGVVGLIFGFLWLVAVGSEDDGGPDRGLYFVFGKWYLIWRVIKALQNDPMSVLPAFGIIAASGLLIGLGVWMW